MNQNLPPAQRWEGPTGAAFFLPENLSEDERAAIVRAERERFSDYLTHAEDRWGAVIEAAAVDGLRVEHTGGGVMTLKLDVPEHSAEIWIGPFGADPEPSYEASVGAYLVDAEGELEGEWTAPDTLDDDASLDELIEWLRSGVDHAKSYLASLS